MRARAPLLCRVGGPAGVQKAGEQAESRRPSRRPGAWAEGCTAGLGGGGGGGAGAVSMRLLRLAAQGCSGVPPIGGLGGDPINMVGHYAALGCRRTSSAVFLAPAQTWPLPCLLRQRAPAARVRGARATAEGACSLRFFESGC